ncbi:alpha/beta fold hydrolase [Bacteroidota bacterium]
MFTAKKNLILFFFLILCSNSILGLEFEGHKRINNTELYCKVVGEGETLVIVHGGPGLGYEYLLPSFLNLADEFRLIFYDQRGCGQSAPFTDADSNFSFNTFIEDLEGIRKEFGIEKMNLIGQSFGALIALNYVLRYTDNVKSLLLLEPAPGSSEHLPRIGKTINERLSPEEKEELNIIIQSEDFSDFNPSSFKKFMNLRLKTYYYDKTKFNPEKLNYFTRDRVEKFFTSAAYLQPFLINFDFYNESVNIKVPVLIIHGEYDPIPTDAINRLHESLQNSEYHLIEECGHFVHIEKPDKYFSLIKTFLSRKKVYNEQ